MLFNEKIQADLTGISETLLITLLMRAKESQKEEALFKDPIAEELTKKIDYDFSKFNSGWKSRAGVAIRTKIFDDVAKNWILKNPNGIVINIGAGLCSRYFRLNEPKIKWIDVDFSPVIDLRNKLFPYSLNNSQLVIADSEIENFSWLEKIPEIKHKKALFVTEGVLMYFEEKQVKKLFQKITLYSNEAQILFDAIATFISKRSRMHDTIKHTNAVFKWGIDKIEDIENWSNYQIEEKYSLLNQYPKRWKLIRFLRKLPLFKRLTQICLVNLK